MGRGIPKNRGRSIKAGVNIGDTLDKPLAEKIGAYHKILGCGTVLRNVKDGIEIWGTGWDGFRNMSHRRPGKIHAVRGPLTSAVFPKWGYSWKMDEKVYGDPGILLPLYWKSYREEKNYEAGWIPHFKDPRELPGARTISPRTDNIQKFVEAMTQCKEIYSSSLHGLIFADAYGIPSQWVTVSWANETTRPWRFKYDDYYASLGLETEPVELGKGSPVVHSIPAEMQNELLRVCPWRK